MMRVCRAVSGVSFCLLALITTGCVEPVRSSANPYSYHILEGVWTWRPIQTSSTSSWAAQLTITHVSDWGRVQGVWQDPHNGTGSFTTQARIEGGNIKLQVFVFNLEYDRETDTLSGPMTVSGPPLLDAQARSVFRSAYFRRTK